MRTILRKTAGRMFLCVLFLLATDAALGAKRRFDQLVPHDVSSYGTVLHYREALNKLKKTPYSALLEEPEVQEFFQQLTGEMSEGLEQFREATGVQPGEIEDLFSGQVAVALRERFRLGAMMGGGAMARPPGMWALFLADLGPNQDRAEDVLDRLIRKAQEDPQVSVSSEEVGAHAVRHLTYQPNGAGVRPGDENLEPELKDRLGHLSTDGQPVHLYVSLEDGILAVAAGERTPLEQHLTLRDGGELQPLSESELYRDLQGRVEGTPDCVSFQNYGPIWEGIRHSSMPLPLPFEPADILTELGIFGVKGQVTTVQIGQEGLSSDAFMLAPPPHKGIIKALVPRERVKVTPPSFVGSDAALYLGGHFDTQVFWQEIQRILQQFAPLQYQQLRAQIDSPNQPLHVERELINTLGNRWFIYVPKEPLSGTEPQKLNLMLATDLRKPDVLRNTLGRLSQMQMMVTEQFQGATVYQSPASQMGEISVQVSLAVVGEKLIIASNPQMAKELVSGSRREASPLLEREDFQQTLPHLPGQPHAFFYLDQKDVARWAWTGLGSLLQGGQMQLPSYETISRYLSVSSSSGRWTEDGLRMRTWIPYPTPE